MLFKCHRSIDNIIDFYDKAHDNKKFIPENLKPHRESQIMTCLGEPWVK